METTPQPLDVQDSKGEIFERGHVRFETFRAPSPEYEPGRIFRVRQDTGRSFGRYVPRGEWVVVDVAPVAKLRGPERVCVVLRKLADPPTMGGYVRYNR